MMAQNPVVLMSEVIPYIMPSIEFYTDPLNPLHVHQGKKMNIKKPVVPVANIVDNNLKFMNDLNAYT